MVIVTVALLTVSTAWLSFRFRRLRPVLEGDPVILVADGRVLERNLRRQRMTVEELGAEARLAQIGSLEDVRYAVLETSGKVSFVTRRPSQAFNCSPREVSGGGHRRTAKAVCAHRPPHASAPPDAVAPRSARLRSRTTSRAGLSSRRPR